MRLNDVQKLAFSNANVPLAGLPNAEPFDWQALSPRYMPLNFALNVGVTLVLGLIGWLSQYTPLAAL